MPAGPSRAPSALAARETASKKRGLRQAPLVTAPIPATAPGCWRDHPRSAACCLLPLAPACGRRPPQPCGTVWREIRGINGGCGGRVRGASDAQHRRREVARARRVEDAPRYRAAASRQTQQPPHRCYNVHHIMHLAPNTHLGALGLEDLLANGDVARGGVGKRGHAAAAVCV